MLDSILQIQIIDDSKADAVLAEHVIRSCKILNPVTVFETGRSFLEHVRTSSDRTRNGRQESSIILVDMVMPQTNGLDVLRELTRDPYAQNCVSVMLSGLQNLKAINEGYQLGAKTFLLKPITKEDILQMIEALADKVNVEACSDGYLLHWDFQNENPKRKTTKISMS